MNLGEKINNQATNRDVSLKQKIFNQLLSVTLATVTALVPFSQVVHAENVPNTYSTQASDLGGEAQINEKDVFTEPQKTENDNAKLQEEAYKKRIEAIENYQQFPVTIPGPDSTPQSVNKQTSYQIDTNPQIGSQTAKISTIDRNRTVLIPQDNNTSALYTDTHFSSFTSGPTEITETTSYEQKTINTHLTMWAQAIVDGTLFFRPTAQPFVPDGRGAFKFNPNVQFKEGTPIGANFAAEFNAPAPEGYAQDLTGGDRLTRYIEGSKHALNIGGLVSATPVGERLNEKTEAKTGNYSIIAGSGEQITYSGLENGNFKTHKSIRATYVNTLNPGANIANIFGLVPLSLGDRSDMANKAEQNRKDNLDKIIPPFEASGPGQIKSQTVKQLSRLADNQLSKTVPTNATFVESIVATDTNTGNSWGTQISAGSVPFKTREVTVENTNTPNPNDLRLQILRGITSSQNGSQTTLNGQKVTDVSAASGIAVLSGEGLKKTEITETYTTVLVPTLSVGGVYNVPASDVAESKVPYNLLSLSASGSVSLLTSMQELDQQGVRGVGRLSAALQPHPALRVNASIVRTNIPSIDTYNTWTVGGNYRIWNEDGRGAVIYGSYTNNSGNEIPFYNLPETATNIGLAVKPIEGLSLNASYFTGGNNEAPQQGTSNQDYSGFRVSASAQVTPKLNINGSFSHSTNGQKNDTDTFGLGVNYNDAASKTSINASINHRNGGQSIVDPQTETTATVNFKKEW